jgi:C-methyltransferase C-terminal domain/Putative zinc binding domain/Methyltransferase domain
MEVGKPALEDLVAAAPTGGADCRLCRAPLRHTFVDLGVSPLANSYLSADDLRQPERFYPLHVYVCEACLLVQLPVWEAPERIFSEYSYFASYSESWVEHARRFVEAAVERFRLGPGSRVVEIASNDGYLLQFVRALGIPALGIEPAANVAAVATERGITTIVDFFGARLAQELRDGGVTADLIVGNNVLAHVPVVHDFVEGLRILLAPGGVITMELPYVLRLIEKREFDTIYHEHFSYFSLHAVERLFADHELILFDVEELPTHGGSLRVYAQHAAEAKGRPGPRVHKIRALDNAGGLHTLERYVAFEAEVRAAKHELLTFLIGAKRDGKTIVGYGAAAKGNTLLNYCGIRTDLLDYVVDRSPHKQGRYTPGTRIPIHEPERIAETRPEFVLILPWNLRDEIVEQMSYIGEWGGRFIVPIPRVEVVDPG